MFVVGGAQRLCCSTSAQLTCDWIPPSKRAKCVPLQSETHIEFNCNGMPQCWQGSSKTKCNQLAIVERLVWSARCALSNSKVVRWRAGIVVLRKSTRRPSLFLWVVLRKGAYRGTWHYSTWTFLVKAARSGTGRQDQEKRGLELNDPTLIAPFTAKNGTYSARGMLSSS